MWPENGFVNLKILTSQLGSISSQTFLNIIKHPVPHFYQLSINIFISWHTLFKFKNVHLVDLNQCMLCILQSPFCMQKISFYCLCTQSEPTLLAIKEKTHCVIFKPNQTKMFKSTFSFQCLLTIIINSLHQNLSFQEKPQKIVSSIILHCNYSWANGNRVESYRSWYIKIDFLFFQYVNLGNVANMQQILTIVQIFRSVLTLCFDIGHPFLNEYQVPMYNCNLPWKQQFCYLSGRAILICNASFFYVLIEPDYSYFYLEILVHSSSFSTEK